MRQLIVFVVQCQGILAIALITNKYVNVPSEHNFFVVFDSLRGNAARRPKKNPPLRVDLSAHRALGLRHMRGGAAENQNW